MSPICPEIGLNWVNGAPTASPRSTPSGHVFRVDRKRGPSGTRSTGCQTGARCSAHRPGVDRAGAAGGRLLHQAHRRSVAARRARPGAARDAARAASRTGVTFADAAAEWLRYVEHDRGCKPSTMRGYRSIARRPPAARRSATMPIEDDHDARRSSAGARRLDRAVRATQEQARWSLLHGDLRAGAEGLRPAAQPGRRRREAASDAAATSRCSRPRRSWRSCAPPPPSRTPRST